MKPLKTLSHYGITAERGFLSEFEIDDIQLPDDFAPIVDAAQQLPDLLTTGRVRHWLKRLPLLDTDEFLSGASDAQIRVAMVHYSFIVQAYVWGESDVLTTLPANLSAPMVAIADALQLSPLLHYSSYVLDNWTRLDKSQPISLSNIRMHQNFLGGLDENWFVLVHVAIEAEAGRALELSVDLVSASDAGDWHRVTHLLIEMNSVWDRINAHFDRMPERCDPYVYYHRVRPYIHGWKNNSALGEGLIYEGVVKYAGRPQAFRGQTGSQSSIVPAMDALFGIKHENDSLREFLAELHQYRPISHRRFIDDLELSSDLRAFAIARGDTALKSAFNACVEQFARFRSRHLEYAATYVNKQASSGAGNDTEVGTGGTPFMKYLKKHRDENRVQTI